MVIKVLRNCSMFLWDKSLATVVTPSAAAGGQMETGWDTPD
jgi:hypothetical protein